MSAKPVIPGVFLLFVIFSLPDYRHF